ncbi:radical SAM protein [Hollandina sp. SP2]
MIFQLFITEACNLNCSYCLEGPKGTGRINKEMMPDIIRFVKSYIKNSFVIEHDITINFNGGEALLEFPLLKFMVEEFKKNEIHNFSISTNFTCISEEILDFLVQNNFFIQLSIDGKKNTHDAFRKDYNGMGSFDTVFANIHLLKRKYPDFKPVFYSMVFTPKSVAQLYENIQFLVENDMCEIIACFNVYETWDEQAIDIYRDQLEKIGGLYREMYDQGKRVHIKLLTQSIEDLLTGRGKPDCGACQDIIGIVPNGDVIACGVFIGCNSYDEYKIGTIYRGIDNKIVERFFHHDAYDLSRCGDCQLLPRCHNKCFAINLKVTGNIKMFPISICSINKYAILEADKIVDYLYSSKNKTFYDEYKNILGENV